MGEDKKKDDPSKAIAVKDEDIVRCGYLTKQGGRIKSWKYRFFKATSTMLCYYKNPKDERPAGVIPLDMVEDVSPVGKPQVRKKNCFQMQTSTRCYFIFHDNKEGMESWINTLLKLVAQRKAYRSLPLTPAPLSLKNPDEDAEVEQNMDDEDGSECGSVICYNSSDDEQEDTAVRVQANDSRPAFMVFMDKQSANEFASKPLAELEEMLRDLEAQRSRDLMAIKDRYDLKRELILGQLAALEEDEEE
eukprot:TRINITY_DN2317_c0_g1_i1.p1 TRINITY_DN2317_c0_g1~~TRINITY_DN2317_c0_g1_i1.p1  ORF type:complete len:247 (-),score=43.27 TRINITY_DN2317_c0_g1_i1:14-754(-)